MKRQQSLSLLIVVALLFPLLVACGLAETKLASLSSSQDTGAPVEYHIVAAEALSEGVYAPVPPMTNPSGEPYDDVFFEDYGVNPFIDTAEDNLSTFAVDVDTGAYAVMRRYVTDGFLPPDESVRVEEFLNYFDQEYPLPDSGAFSINLEGAPAPYGENERYYLVRVGIQGFDVSEEERPDAMLIFVIDVSGSMDMENRLGLVKQSLSMLTRSLRPSDRIGIVVYGSDARVVLSPTEVAEADQILLAIDTLQPEGSTNAEAGLRVAYDMAGEFQRPGEISRLILASDGVANVGNVLADEILQHAEEGIALSTFGFGMGNYNDVLMEQLADKGNGAYAYIDTIDEAERVFSQHLTSAIMTIAKDAKIQVTFNQNVLDRYRLLGYENRDVADENFRNDDVDAGEIGAGHSVTALYEVRVAENAPADEVAMTVAVRYADPETDEVQEISQSISFSEFAQRFEDASPRFQLDAVVAEFAEVLRNSFWAQDNSLDALVTDARRIGEYLVDDSSVREFVQLVELAASLSE